MNGTRPDAAAMRNAAAQVRARSERISAVASQVDSTVSSMTYAGPAADQFRSTIEVQQGLLRQAASIMAQLTDILNRGAAQVEADPLGFYQAGGRL